MLGEPKNILDHIGEKLAEFSSQIILQASLKRALEKKAISSVTRKEKRCYAEDDEDPFLPCDDDETFSRARLMGRIEGKLIKFLENRIFQYDEDELQQLTHENIYKEMQFLYEEGRDIMEELLHI